MTRSRPSRSRHRRGALPRATRQSIPMRSSRPSFVTVNVDQGSRATALSSSALTFSRGAVDVPLNQTPIARFFEPAWQLVDALACRSSAGKFFCEGGGVMIRHVLSPTFLVCVVQPCAFRGSNHVCLVISASNVSRDAPAGTGLTQMEIDRLLPVSHTHIPIVWPFDRPSVTTVLDSCG